MKKVYQTIVDKGCGNCMQAVVASLLELDLNSVPNFIESINWITDFYDFFSEKGYNVSPVTIFTLEEWERLMSIEHGIEGYWYASVSSKTYEETSHAVVIDENLNVVHDPNPNQLWVNQSIISVLDKSSTLIYCTADFHFGRNGEIIFEGKIIIE